MKILKYNLCTRVNRGSEENPMWEEFLSAVELSWSKANEEIAKKEAYNGEYTIEEDGTISIPTDAERIEALENALLEMLGVAYNG